MMFIKILGSIFLVRALDAVFLVPVENKVYALKS